MASQSQSLANKPSKDPKKDDSKVAKLKRLLAAVKKFCRSWHLNHLAPVPFIAFFMLVGAIIFWLSENSAEMQAIVERRKGNIALLSETAEGILKVVRETAEDASKRKARVTKLLDSLFEQLGHSASGDLEPQQWTFMTAMYFSGTLFTTIGYGDIACETTTGRVCTVIYSVIGIPLTLITLNELGKFLYKIINEWMAAITRKWRQFFPKQRKVNWRRRASQMIITRAIHKEAERKATHFFKDQRIATREIVFDYDLKSLYEESRKESDTSAPVDLEKGEKPERKSTGEQQPQMGAQQIGTLQMGQPDAPRMHVMVAITFTVSWVVFCAGLFQYVEGWTFGRAIYFVCISLLTVGLGDEKVSRREYMVLFFAFVMIGLSLVSMCINVIQNSIEDFYKRLLMQMLKNGDANSMRNNRLAKLLLPLLSKEKKQMMMRKVADEAQKSGVEIPSNFADLDQLDQIFEKKDDIGLSLASARMSVVSQSSCRTEPPDPSPLPEIVIEQESIEDEDQLLHVEQMQSLLVPMHNRRRDSFQLQDSVMKLVPFIDTELKPAEEEELMKLEINIEPDEEEAEEESDGEGATTW